MYHGTIDLSTPTNNGQATMTQTERNAWFNTYETQGEIEGFYYSLDIRGDRKSTNTPVSGGDQIIDGYHNIAILGGNGARQAQNWTNAVWPNVITHDVLINSNVLQAGLQTLYLGEEIQVRYNYRSYTNSSNITIYADIDRNPYNNNNAAIIGTENLSSTSSVIVQSSVNWVVTGLNVGTKYYFYTKINDGTHLRYIYSSHEFNIEQGVGIKDILTKEISIFPNPTNGLVFINAQVFQNPESLNIELTDLSGKIIYQSLIQKNQLEIDLSSCNPGVYLIKIQTDKEIF